MNLDKTIVDLNGKEVTVENSRVRDFMATIIATEKSEDPLRSYSLAMSLKNGENKLNQSDLDFITKAVKGSTSYTPLVIGQILQELGSK